jgi:hypothetical protein
MAQEVVHRKRILSFHRFGTEYNAEAILLYVWSFYCCGLTAQLPPAR